ncbi:MAG: hypothetical protein RL660_2660 [Bacteroidota bacterium]|jgi:predicted  nucleic acid-binding Zn ribbon protein
MYTIELSLLNKKAYDSELLLEEFHCLLGYYRKNGQLLSDNEAAYFADDKLICNIAALELDALHKKYTSEWASKQLKKVELLCGSKLQIRNLGKSFETYAGACKCRKHKFFILFTHLLNTAGPLDCGDCLLPVPLYKIKALDTNLRQSILSWESNYKACDHLQLGCVVGEKWATKQMSDVNSELSKEGIDNCKRIYAATGIPTYYYLFNVRNVKAAKDKARKCPSCQGEWLLDKSLGTLYDFKCDRCSLLSSLSANAK